MTAQSLRTLLAALSDQELRSIHGRWHDQRHADLPRSRLVSGLAQQMADDELVMTRLKQLPEKLGVLLELFLDGDSHQHELEAILAAAPGVFRSRYELEASLVALQREGFAFPVRLANEEAGADRWAVPQELAVRILELRRSQRAELLGTLSLHGFLQQRYYQRERQADGADGTRRAGDHARRVYKLYLLDSSIRTRIEGLDPGVRRVFERALTGFGGIMPIEEFDRQNDEEELDIDIELVAKGLQDAMLGTVAPLRLARFGVEPLERAVLIFHEIVLHGLNERGDKLGGADSRGVSEILSSGVDLLTNVGRFLREVASSKVQFTVEGQVYKASSRRIVKGFLAIPGGYMPAETQARFIYAFCRSRRLVERSGERALRLSSGGLEFEHKTLHEKLRALLSFVVEERALQGEHFHQVRLRKILLRLLRRLPAEAWHDATFVPFLARNGYFGKLDELRVEDYFAARFKGGGYVPTESAHMLCLHLLDWIKRRLYPLGLVDIGLADGRPVALRLSRLGAELLGAESAVEVGGQRSNLLLNPDFELILFPGDDEHEAVHALDQFCERLKSDHTHHFRITRESLRAALQEGVPLATVVQELTDRSRTALPQNVLYSLDDWADQAGLLVLDEEHVLRGRRSEVLDRFVAHPRLGPLVHRRIDAERLALVRDTEVDALRELARDFGFLIEIRSGEGHR